MHLKYVCVVSFALEADFSSYNHIFDRPTLSLYIYIYI